jgi:hypothetical protein
VQRLYLDRFPDFFNATRNAESFDLLWTLSTGVPASQIAALFGSIVGVFQCRAKLLAMELAIGDSFQLTHQRFCFFSFPTFASISPEIAVQDITDGVVNGESRQAVVLGKEIDLSEEFPVKLTFFKPIKGNYPAANLT